MEKSKLLRYFAGEASDKEIAEIEQWLREDTDGRRQAEYEDAHRIFNGIALYSETFTGRQAARKMPRSGAGFRWGMAVAAAVALALVVGNIARKRTLDRIYAQSQVYEMPAGKSMKLVLEDGTSIWMNSQSRVEVPKVFRKKDRTISLSHGEILLDVAPDAKRPFRIKTFAADVKVLGTKFIMNVNEDYSEFSTTLIRGSVAVTPSRGAEGTIILSPNEQVYLGTDGQLAVRTVEDPAEMTVWVEGMIDLTGLGFDALMRKFEQAFNVTIIIERKDLPVLDITRGKVRISDGIEHALDVLRLSCDFDYLYDLNTNTIVIK